MFVIRSTSPDPVHAPRRDAQPESLVQSGAERLGFDDIDAGRVSEMVRFVRTHGTREALDAVLPSAASIDARNCLAAHCRFTHGAVLVFPRGVTDAVDELREWGLEPSAPIPSVVVRDRLRRRHGVGQADTWIVDARLRGNDGDQRSVELFLLPTGAGDAFRELARRERSENGEIHLAFDVEPDEVVIHGLREMLILRCGMTCDGGGFNVHRNVSVFYFRSSGSARWGRWPRRLELLVTGEFPSALDTHLGTYSRPVEIHAQ